MLGSPYLVFTCLLAFASHVNICHVIFTYRISKVKKSLKIPKNLSESVNRRTDNTMAKRKGTNNDLQNIHIKLKIE